MKQLSAVILAVVVMAAIGPGAALAADNYDPTITWAVSGWSVDSGIEDAIETLLLADPPEDATTYIYGITHVSTDGDDSLVSIANLDGVESPYEEWTVEYNAVWFGAVLVEPDGESYLASYYEVTPEGGGSATIYFPWRQGYGALYGELGVHDGTIRLANSVAVDFFGSDVWGSYYMPDVAYTAAAGTITAVCADDNNVGVRLDGPAGDFYYLHLVENIGLTVGAAFTQGQPLGNIVRGSFGDYGSCSACPEGGNCTCGGACQQATSYHIHFAFVPDSNGYFQFEGCVLNTATDNFICGTETIGPRGNLPIAGGGSGTYDAPLIVDPEDPSQDIGLSGGETQHIWDGLVGAMITFIGTYVTPIFPGHTQIGLSVYTENIVNTAMPIFKLVDTAQLVSFGLFFTVLGVILIEKIVLVVFVLYRLILRLIPMAA